MPHLVTVLLQRVLLAARHALPMPWRLLPPTPCTRACASYPHKSTAASRSRPPIGTLFIAPIGTLSPWSTCPTLLPSAWLFVSIFGCLFLLFQTPAAHNPHPRQPPPPSFCFCFSAPTCPQPPPAQVYLRYASKYGCRLTPAEVLQRFRDAYNTPWRGSNIRYVDDGRPFWRFIVAASTGCESEAAFEVGATGGGPQCRPFARPAFSFSFFFLSFFAGLLVASACPVASWGLLDPVGPCTLPAG